MTRAFWVWLHRWCGLAMAAFLILVGLTGGLLAFYPELDRWLTPQFHLQRREGKELGAAALARRAESLAPQARARSVEFGDGDAAVVRMEARPDATRPLEFNQLFLDPVTGEEIGRRLAGPLPLGLDTLAPFIYRLHYALALGPLGAWILGIVALVWTIDCFVAFYLTLPVAAVSRKSYWARWKPAWSIKLRGSFYRVNFDLHRASGLWLWALLLIFAWSSVYMNLNAVYTRTTRAFFDLEQSFWFRDREKPTFSPPAPLNWEAAQTIAERIADEQSRAQGFTIDRPVELGIDRDKKLYEYRVHSSRDIGEKYGQTFFWFDAGTGELVSMIIPTGQHTGNTLTTWLVELHMANIFGLPYKILVCALGLVIAMLSTTGVYIWWKKRRARKSRRFPAGASPAPASRGSGAR